MYECECLFNDLLIVVVVYLFIRSLVMSCHSEKRKSMYRKHTATEELKSIFFFVLFRFTTTFFQRERERKKETKNNRKFWVRTTQDNCLLHFFLSFFRNDFHVITKCTEKKLARERATLKILITTSYVLFIF